ncbi:unnamed protein product, partial [Didymodactylos carnosus]
MDWFDQNPLPSINLITAAPLSDVVRELPILSLQNPGAESLLDPMFVDHTSMMLNCRDINLAQELCQTLSQVNTQSLTFRHSSDTVTTLPPLLQTCLQTNPNAFNGSIPLQTSVAPAPLQFPSQFQTTNQLFSYNPTGFPSAQQQISPNTCSYAPNMSYPHSFVPLPDNSLTINHNFSPSYSQTVGPQATSVSSVSNNVRSTMRPTAVVPPIQKEQQQMSKEQSFHTPSSSSLTSVSISPIKQELICIEKSISPPPQLFPHDQHQLQCMVENNAKSPQTDIEMSIQQPRIILQKLEINEALGESKPLRRTTTTIATTKRTSNPQLDLPSDFTPDLIKELLQDGCSLNGLAGSSLTRQRRTTILPSSSRTASNKRRYIDDDGEEEEDDADERSRSPTGDDDNYQQPKKRIRRKEQDNSLVTANVTPTKHQQPLQLAKDVEKQRIKEEREREKVERLEKLGRKAMDIEDDPLENTAFQRFVELLDNFIDDYDRYEERLDESIKLSQASQSDTEDENSMLDVLLPELILDELSTLSEKLKLSTYMNRIEKTKLKRLLKILSLRIKQGIKLHPVLNHNKQQQQQQDEKKGQDDNYDDDEEERLWRDIIIERLLVSANASKVALNIMTTLNMPKEVFIEHVIENLALFIKAQLTKTIFPEYDPVYRSDLQSKDPLLAKQKRSKVFGSRCKMVQILYNKIVSLLQGLIDLVQLSRYPDTIILTISSFSVSCIFVENVMDLQQHSISILTQIFARYDKHRDSILDDLLLSLVRLPTSKKSIRSYHLNSGESIQMFTALIMHLIHSPVSNVKSFQQITSSTSTVPVKISTPFPLKPVQQQADEVTEEMRLLNTYTLAQNLAFKFLTAFFRTCGMKQGEDDYRTIFENFLHDLLITANKPEWPSCEILLSLLSRILMTNFSNKTIAINIRLQSLDYLGSVAAQLRKDTMDPNYLNSKDTLARLDEIVKRTLASIETDDELATKDTNDPLRFNKGLIIYLNDLSQSDSTSNFAKMFYIGQWLRDLTLTTEKLTQSLTKSKLKKSTTNDNKDDLNNDDDDIENEHVKTKTLSIEDEIELKQIEKQAILKLLTLPSTTGLISFQKQHTHLDIDYDDACLLIRYLTLNRPFLRTFDVYLKQIANIFQSEAGTNIRSKAMKCLCTVVEADPTILSRNDIKSCVQVGLTDKSISVREAAIDLIGRYIVGREQLVLQYYDILCERSLDTGVSVRKRVVKIFRDICLHQPSFVKIPDICSRLLRRIQDEESIRKLVLETFQLLWFTPSRLKSDIRTRVQIIIDVILDFKKQNYQWLENLLKEFLHTNVTTMGNELDRKRINEQRKDVLKSIREIIDELIEYVLKMESLTVMNDTDQGASDKMVSTFIALYALGKAKPDYLIQHVSTIVEYLNIKCTTHNDNTIVQYVAKILEFTVPLIKSAPETLIFKLEESLTK